MPQQKRRPNQTVEFSFNPEHPAAVKWAKKHAAKLVTDISKTTRKNIRDIIVSGFAEGRDVRELAKDIFEEVGDVKRAMLIARTETMTAVNAGQRQLWDQAVEEGVLTGDEERVWLFAELPMKNGELCPICQSMADQKRDLDEDFRDLNGDLYDGPPAHPNCRCTVGLVPARARRRAAETKPTKRNAIRRLAAWLMTAIGNGNNQYKKDNPTKGEGRRANVPVTGEHLLDSDALSQKFLEVGGIPEPQDPNKVGGRLLGFYDPNTKTIYVNNSLPEKSDVRFGEHSVDPTQAGTLNHEYAHHLWYNGLTAPEKSTWTKAYSASKPDYWRAQISTKASRGADEAFAELYAAHVAGHDVTSRLGAVKKTGKLFLSMMTSKPKALIGNGNNQYKKDNPTQGKLKPDEPRRLTGRIPFDQITERRFLFNPKTKEMLLGVETQVIRAQEHLSIFENPDGEYSHADVAHALGEGPRSYDRFTVHGFIRKGSVIISRTVPVKDEPDQLFKFYKHLSNSGAPKDMEVSSGWGGVPLNELLKTLVGNGNNQYKKDNPTKDREEFPDTNTDPAPGRDYFYHSTPSSNVTSIAETGLKPVGKGIPISFAPSLDSAAFWFEGSKQWQPGPHSLLRVKREDVELEQKPSIEYSTDDFEQDTAEVSSATPVSADRIEVFKDGRWVGLNKIRSLIGNGNNQYKQDRPTKAERDTFHGTSVAAAEKIKAEGLKPGFGGHVYAAKDIKLALSYAANAVKTPNKEVAVVVLDKSARSFFEKKEREHGEGGYMPGKFIQGSKRVPPEFVKEVRVYSVGDIHAADIHEQDGGFKPPKYRTLEVDDDLVVVFLINDEPRTAIGNGNNQYKQDRPTRGRSERAQRALATYKPSTRAKQQKAARVVSSLAQVLNGEPTTGNEPMDVLVNARGQLHGVEIKALIDNNHDKITMHPESRRRKERWVRKNKAKGHTVAVDTRTKTPTYYYKKGFGAFRISNMERLTRDELKQRLAS
jgi:RNA:NAD 2'-phosphotransferase (TPT1/KptA family)